MIKLKSLLFETYYYHITSKKNLASIKTGGLIPNSPKDMSGEQVGIYLFSSREDAEDSWDQWMGDRFDEDEELVLLTIDGNGLQIEPSTVGWEVISKSTIPPQNIINVEDV